MNVQAARSGGRELEGLHPPPQLLEPVIACSEGSRCDDYPNAHDPSLSDLLRDEAVGLVVSAGGLAPESHPAA